MQITEDKIKSEEEKICKGEAKGDLDYYIICVAEHTRLQAIRKRKGYSN